MCGIGGVFTNNKSIRHQELAQQLVASILHRGPDYSDSIRVSEYCSLSHARLKIIDLSDNANQPMYCYQKRYVIVFNGEIYNYKHLRLELQRVAYQSRQKPYPFQTQSDTEVILAAYHRWGEECVNHLDGMFAFAIYDTEENSLFLARDRQGKKPLYYIHRPDVFAFASEVRALMHSSLSSRELDVSQLFDYFQYQTVFSPHTLVKDIQLLDSACTLKVSFSQNQTVVAEKKKYWVPVKEITNESDISYDEAKSKVRELLFQSVEKRLVSDVPLGAFLSGGIDSSAIVGIMKKIFSSEVNTFHVTTNVSELAENEFAQSLSAIYQTRHHNIVLKEREVLQSVSEALEKTDYPTGDGINTYIVSNATKQTGITVALSGVGGDELFAGYPQFKVMSRLHHLSSMGFASFGKIAASVLPVGKRSFFYRLKVLMQANSLSADTLFPYYRQVFLQKNIPLMGNQFPSFFHTHADERYLLKNHHIISYISILEMDNYMQHVLLRDTDQFSMANALEVRAPFLDTALVEFVLSLPDAYKYPVTPKKLLTDAVQDILPENIVQRRKMGFVLPFMKWMREDLKNLCEEKIKHLSEQKFVDGKKLLTEWKAYQTGKHDRWWMFWHLIVLQYWMEKNNIVVK
ncbi:MAG: asparagine synthetase B [Bacteroidia bacterium]|nr:MAG: asparagine synthetase B [Bacteroidia bacterium]